MQITLPKKIGTPPTSPTIDLGQIVIVGANGAGKTRFASDIERRYPGQTHRIAAQKSLVFPKIVSPTSKKQAEALFKFGHYQESYSDEHYSQNKMQSKYQGRPDTTLLNDYDKLLVLLHTDEYEDALNYKEGRTGRPTTKLDRVQKIWEAVLPHRKLLKTAGIIETFPTGNPSNIYNASEMSDGERVIFYLAGEVICASENAIIIIDEPEMHIHKLLIKPLFDLIELERPDCSFIYLTHDIDFAFTRQNAIKVWLRSFDGNNIWDYEILDETTPIPEQLYLEVLGSRKPVIFIEGDNSSIDYQLYEQIFPNHTLKPLGGCEKVIQSVPAFNDHKTFHHIEAFGIIDRDRRPDSDLAGLNRKNIWVLDVAESENLFLLESVVRAVVQHMGQNPDNVFNIVRENLVGFFESQLEPQALLHYKEMLRRNFLALTNFTSKNINDVTNEIDSNYAAVNKLELFENIRQRFEDVLSSQDYNSILKLFNLKGALIPNSGICPLTGIRNKEEYIRVVITLLKRKDPLSDQIKAGIESMIIKNA